MYHNIKHMIDEHTVLEDRIVLEIILLLTRKKLYRLLWAERPGTTFFMNMLGFSHEVRALLKGIFTSKLSQNRLVRVRFYKDLSSKGEALTQIWTRSLLIWGSKSDKSPVKTDRKKTMQIVVSWWMNCRRISSVLLLTCAHHIY